MEQEFAGLAALYAVIELSKHFVNKSKKHECDLGPKPAAQLESLFKAHDQYDESGRLKWHIPVSLMQETRQILEQVRLGNTQHETIIDLLERIDRHTENDQTR